MATPAVSMIPSTAPAQTKTHFMHTCVLGLSIPQVIMGILCIIFQGVLFSWKTELHFTGHGLWSGIIFIMAGVLGITSAITKKTPYILAFMTMAIIAATVTIGLLVISAIELGFYHQRDRYHSSDSYIWDQYGRSTPSPGLVAKPLDGIMIFISVAQAICAIMSSAFACHGLCGGNQGRSLMVATQAQYVPGMNGQPQMVFLPVAQQAQFMTQGSGMAGAAYPPGPVQYTSPGPAPPQYTDPSEETKVPLPN